MKIGELARLTGTSVETIRFYERAALLPPAARTQGNYRDFGQPHVERLEFIRRCRALDLGLDRVRDLLAFKDEPCGHCERVNEIVEEQIAMVSEQISELQGLREQLVALSSVCPGGKPTADCTILKALADDRQG
jgi:Cd(II)/Pb(II)-responsive transcriptional regulator